ncbi:MAG TPA: 50S ribosomal protein L24 [Nitrososphaeraceae archaeon]|nr:50S ribosomal protein L24 [Nitrososphaeraceae archaeon]
MPKHMRDRSIAAHLGDNLRQVYRLRSYRVIKGDTVRVVRGEYSGIEGKVESVDTMTGGLAIEGIQREKVRGGNVKVRIHSSNVMITSMNLDDKYRQERLQDQSSKEKSKTHRRARMQKRKKRMTKEKAR